MNSRMLVAICLTLLAGSTAATWVRSAPTEWQNTEDYSRGQLFEEHLVATAAPLSSVDRSKALNGPFEFPKNAANDGGRPRTNAIFGIDVSHWSSVDPQCNAKLDPSKDIDFSTLSGQRIRFVYVKATQDVNFRDCRFAEYWSALGALTSKSRPLRGAYHFLTATTPGHDQALSYVRLRAQLGGFDKAELPSVLDLEWDKTSTNPDRWVGTKSDAIVDAAIDWLTYVAKQSGKNPIVYTSKEFLTEHNFTAAQLDRLKPYHLWIADYSQTRRAIEQPSVPAGFAWALWQFTAASKLSIGSPKPLDASIFKGTDAEFADLMQISGS
jgi:lysozyme